MDQCFVHSNEGVVLVCSDEEGADTKGKVLCLLVFDIWIMTQKTRSQSYQPWDTPGAGECHQGEGLSKSPSLTCYLCNFKKVYVMDKQVDVRINLSFKINNINMQKAVKQCEEKSAFQSVLDSFVIAFIFKDIRKKERVISKNSIRQNTRQLHFLHIKIFHFAGGHFSEASKFTFLLITFTCF